MAKLDTTVTVTMNTSLAEATVDRIMKEVDEAMEIYLREHSVAFNGMCRVDALRCAYREGAATAINRLIVFNCEISKGGDDGGKA